MALYFTEEDKPRLLSMVTPLMAVEYLGISHKKMGSNISIICPSKDHNDHNFGNCMISKQGRLCKCYACGRTFNALDLLEEVGGYTFYESMCILAKLAGVESDYFSKRKKAKKKVCIKLTPEERKRIGICVYPNIRLVTGVKEKYPEKGNYFRHQNGEYITYEMSKRNPWFELLEKEPSTAKWLIRNKCREKMLQLELMRTELKNPVNSEFSVSSYLILRKLKIPMEEIIKIIDEEYRKVETIYHAFGGNETKEKQAIHFLEEYIGLFL